MKKELQNKKNVDPLKSSFELQTVESRKTAAKFHIIVSQLKKYFFVNLRQTQT